MSELFSDNFPIVSSEEKLNRIKKKYPQYDEYYITSGCLKERKEGFEKLWEEFKPFADKHFLSQVKLNFHQRTWEMYLSVLLIKNGIEIFSSDKGPDIGIKCERKNIWIECVAPTKGSGVDCVPNMGFGHIMDVPEEQMLLRISNSLDEKFKRYEYFLKDGAIQPDDIFIIAINRGDLEHIDPIKPLIFSALFSVGDLVLPINIKEDTNKSQAGKPFYKRRKIVLKESGVEVPMDFFETKDHEGITGIVYSMHDVLNHNGRKCIYINNPLCINPLRDGFFSFFDNWKAVLNNNNVNISRLIL